MNIEQKMYKVTPASPYQSVKVLDVIGVRNEMQRQGFRFSELPDHIADLDSGYVLHADNGCKFELG